LVTQQLLENESLDAQAFNRLLGRSPKADLDRPVPGVELAPSSPALGNGDNSHVE